MRAGFLIPMMALAVAGCATSMQDKSEMSDAAEKPMAEAKASMASGKLAMVLAAQPDEAKARFAARHPRETIEFFGLEPGMTVVEGLPGGGWYTKMLLPYLGSDGHLIGANYSMEMWPLFSFASDEFLASQASWQTTWPEGAEAWRGDAGAEISTFVFGSLPEAMEGTADAVLMIRAMHNLARFESQGGHLSTALDDMYRVLKPGGVVGIVQHEAPDSASDDWADGSRGYLKRAKLIAAMRAAGFEYEAQSAINANPKDRPGEEDIVWRLAPSLATSRDNPELRAKMQAIGESNRMTLRFRKPG